MKPRVCGQVISQSVSWWTRLCFCVLAVTASATSMVSAEERSAAQHAADVLFEEGKSALKAGHWDQACERFQRSMSLDPSPSTLVKIARCQEREGKWRAAISSYDRALQMTAELPQDNEHTRDLEELARTAKQKALSRIGHVSVRWSSGPSTAHVVLDSEQFEVTTETPAFPVDPGQHVVALMADGYESESLAIDVREGEAREISLELKRSSPAAPPPARPQQKPGGATTGQQVVPPAVDRRAPANASLGTPAIPNGQSPSGDTRRVVGYVTGGIGISALGVAAYLGYRAQRLTSDSHVDGHCDAAYVCDGEGLGILRQASRAQTEALILAAGGTVLLGTGVLLVMATPRSTRSVTTSVVRWSVRLGASTAVVGAQW